MSDENSGLKDKVIVITGAGQGLGRATALALGEGGAKVALLGRTESKVQAVADKMNGNGLAIGCELQDSNAVKAAFAKVADKWGGVDVLINNAASYTIFRIEKATDEQIQDCMNSNFLGPIHCIREAIPSMRERGTGDIINLTTESVNHPIPYLTLYAATKGGIEVLSRGLRDELREDKIRVTTLRLGGIADPDKTTSQFDPAVAAEFREEFIASGRARYVGSGQQLKTVTDAITNLITLPRDANADILELRSI